MTIQFPIQVNEVTSNTFVLYRIVKISRKDPLYLQHNFQSNYETHAAPRGIEQRAAIIHRGISMFQHAKTAVKVAQTFPKIGSYIAQITFTDGHGVNYAQTSHPNHYTVWGDPLKIAALTTDIIPVIITQ